jgi:hypothetical protein
MTGERDKDRESVSVTKTASTGTSRGSSRSVMDSSGNIVTHGESWTESETQGEAVSNMPDEQTGTGSKEEKKKPGA